jgi:protein arginine N-methyltransferase 1
MAELLDKCAVKESKGANGENETKGPTSSEYYWDSYAHFGIHEEMLKDEVRTRSYMNAIEQNKHLFAGKIVLDVGCGTGILSMFAARAGAKKVYAVECSNIVHQARQIIKDNNMEDVIEVHQGKMEEIELPVTRVDIIISEWMGYFLLYESMLDTVLYARDKYLDREKGIIMPDKAVLYLTAIEDGAYMNDKIHFWDNVYGFNMSTIKKIAMTEPLVDTVDPKTIISNYKPVLNLDLLTCKVKDLSFEANFKLKFARNDFCHALVGFFECAFTQVHKPIIFSTSPHATSTHWKQVVFYLTESLTVCSGEEMEGIIKCHPNERNPRDLDINISTKFEGRHMVSDKVNLYRLR